MAPIRTSWQAEQGKDGLGAHQRGGTHVVQAIRLEDHGSSLEPHTFAGTIVDRGVLLQQLAGQAPESTQHSPAIVQHLSLAEALDGIGVCCRPSTVPTVVTRVLTGQVVWDAAACNVRALPLLAVRAIPARQIHLGAAAVYFPAAANMATDGVYWVAISSINLFTTNGSAMWDAQFSTGPWPVTAACS